MNLSLIGGLLKPVTQLIDSLHTSDEERLELTVRLEQARREIVMASLELEARVVDAQSRVIAAEAAGASWLQRSWRPITMLFFLVVIAGDVFGLSAHRLPEQAWTLLQIGLGGYVAGRSAEKLVPAIQKKASGDG